MESGAQSPAFTSTTSTRAIRLAEHLPLPDAATAAIPATSDTASNIIYRSGTSVVVTATEGIYPWPVV